MAGSSPANNENITKSPPPRWGKAFVYLTESTSDLDPAQLKLITDIDSNDMGRPINKFACDTRQSHRANVHIPG